MSSFSPAESFRRFNQEERVTLKSNAYSRWLILALQSALAEMSWRGTKGDEMAGATRFIATFLDLAEDPTPPPQRYPVPDLPSIDDPNFIKNVKEKKL